MKNLKDPIGNQIRDLPACSAVPQQTVTMQPCSSVGRQCYCNCVMTETPLIPVNCLLLVRNKTYVYINVIHVLYGGVAFVLLSTTTTVTISFILYTLTFHIDYLLLP